MEFTDSDEFGDTGNSDKSGGSEKSDFSGWGRGKKKRFFLGKSPKQRTPPTHPYGLGLKQRKSQKFHEIS